mmetsp:Transcript_30364/g.84889  ORF Transcript_30364/g.84889 Transcript_30364/m.84889 type:complete len:325 (-) Transcript_30364:4750-5724(-)
MRGQDFLAQLRGQRIEELGIDGGYLAVRAGLSFGLPCGLARRAHGILVPRHWTLRLGPSAARRTARCAGSSGRGGRSSVRPTCCKLFSGRLRQGRSTPGKGRSARRPPGARSTGEGRFTLSCGAPRRPSRFPRAWQQLCGPPAPTCRLLHLHYSHVGTDGLLQDVQKGFILPPSPGVGPLTRVSLRRPPAPATGSMPAPRKTQVHPPVGEAPLAGRRRVLPPQAERAVPPHEGLLSPTVEVVPQELPCPAPRVSLARPAHLLEPVDVPVRWIAEELPHRECAVVQMHGGPKVAVVQWVAAPASHGAEAAPAGAEQQRVTLQAAP